MAHGSWSVPLCCAQGSAGGRTDIFVYPAVSTSPQSLVIPQTGSLSSSSFPCFSVMLTPSLNFLVFPSFPRCTLQTFQGKQASLHPQRLFVDVLLAAASLAVFPGHCFPCTSFQWMLLILPRSICLWVKTWTGLLFSLFPGSNSKLHSSSLVSKLPISWDSSYLFSSFLSLTAPEYGASSWVTLAPGLWLSILPKSTKVAFTTLDNELSSGMASQQWWHVDLLHSLTVMVPFLVSASPGTAYLWLKLEYSLPPHSSIVPLSHLCGEVPIKFDFIRFSSSLGPVHSLSLTAQMCHLTNRLSRVLSFFASSTSCLTSLNKTLTLHRASATLFPSFAGLGSWLVLRDAGRLLLSLLLGLVCSLQQVV